MEHLTFGDVCFSIPILLFSRLFIYLFIYLFSGFRFVILFYKFEHTRDAITSQKKNQHCFMLLTKSSAAWRYPRLVKPHSKTNVLIMKTRGINH